MKPLERISHSCLSTFEDCPGMWWSRYVLGEKTPSGTAAAIGSSFGDRVVSQLGVPVNPKSPSASRPVPTLGSEDTAQVDALVQTYLTHPMAWTKGDIAEAGVHLDPDQLVHYGDFYEVPRPQFPLRPFIGYIDLMISDPLPRIIDLKTAAKTEFRLGWAHQTLMYALAVQAASAEIHAVIKTKVPKAVVWQIQLKPERFRWALKRVFSTHDAISRALECGDHPPETPGYYCSWCPREHKCPIRSLQGLQPVTEN